MGKPNMIKNYIYNMLYEVLALIIPLITTPYISRVLGATAIGDYGFTSGIVSYFTIVAALGTVNYAKREIAYNQHDKYTRSKLFYEIFVFRLITSSIATIAYIVFIQFTPSVLRVLYVIQILTLVAGVFDISWFFQGMEDFKIIAIRNSIVKIAGTVCIFVFVKNVEDLWKYTVILCLSNLIGNLYTWIGLDKYLIKVNMTVKEIFRHTPEILALFATVVAIQIYTILDQTMIGIFANNTEVGYYAQAQKIVKIALMIISSFTAVLMPRIANLYENKDTQEIRNYLNKSVEFIMVLAVPMMVGCASVSGRFVPIFFGEGYEKVSSLLIILSILFVVLGCGQLFGTILVSLKLQREYTISVCLGAVCNFVLNIFMIQHYWSVGAALASVVAETIVTVRNLCILNKQYAFVGSLCKAFIRYGLSSLIIVLVTSTFHFFIKNSVIALCFEVAFAAGSYFIVLLLQRDKFIFELLKKRFFLKFE